MLYDMLQVNYFLGYSIFKQVIIIIFLKPGHLSQPGSVCFNLDQFGASKKTRVTGHCLPI